MGEGVKIRSHIPQEYIDLGPVLYSMSPPRYNNININAIDVTIVFNFLFVPITKYVLFIYHSHFVNNKVNNSSLCIDV